MGVVSDFYTRVQTDRRQEGGLLPEKVAFILAHVGSGQLVLDIGCNTGVIGARLVDAGNDVYGVDIGESDLKIASKRGLKTQLLNLESDDLPYEDDCFDVVLLGDIIEHIFDTDHLLRQCRRVLKERGQLIVTTPNVASLGRRCMLLAGISPFLEYSTELTTNDYPSVGHIRYYTAKNLRRQLRYHSFEVESLVGNGLNLGILRLKAVGRLVPSLCPMLFCSARLS